MHHIFIIETNNMYTNNLIFTIKKIMPMEIVITYHSFTVNFFLKNFKINV